MKVFLLATLLSVFTSWNIQLMSPQGVGIEWVQSRSSITLQADFNEVIYYELLNTSNQVVISSSFQGPNNEMIHTTSLTTGDYTIVCDYISGSDVFEVFIDNE